MKCVILTCLYVAVTRLTSARHIEIEYGNFADLTCYTCPQKESNEACNKWAPNIPCPSKHTVCKTAHLMDKVTGETVQVDKTCSLPTHCTADHVGCRTVDRSDALIECVSCCTESLCNVAVPYNVTTSVKLSQTLTPSSAGQDMLGFPVLCSVLLIQSIIAML